jgi:DNA-binding XRE family transcriptional regulator
MSGDGLDKDDYKEAAAIRFGENLFLARRTVALSQEQLALRADLHRTEIGHLEGGRRLPRIDTLVKLASSVEVPSGDLLKGLAWVPAHQRTSGHFIADAGRWASMRGRPDG